MSNQRKIRIRYVLSKVARVEDRDGNQGPGLRAWPVKACCGAGLGFHLVSPQNCGPRGTGSKRDGSKAGRVKSGTGRKRDGLNPRDFEDPQL